MYNKLYLSFLRMSEFRIFLLTLFGFLGLFLPMKSFADPGASLISATIINFNQKLADTRVNVKDKQDIIKTFCELANPEVTRGNSSLEETYDSSQSLFLFLLCQNKELKPDYFREQTQKYLKPEAEKKLKKSKVCKDRYQEKCNLAELTDQIMTALFSELFSFKQAELFGLSQKTLLDEQTFIKKINLFAEEKFAIFKLCDDPDHAYPQTCKIMKNQMKTLLKRLKQFEILDTDSLFEAIEEKKSDQDLKSCLFGEDYDLALCGTLGETDHGLKPFINLLYNELTRYTLFTNYYSQILSQRNEVDFALNDEIQHLKSSQEKFLFLTNQSLEDLNELAATYPLHIGMLIYWEDLLRFRNRSLSKLVSPFYTLYHKLRNVQSNS